MDDKLLGIVDYEIDEVFCQHEEQCTAVECLSFLTTVVALYASEEIAIVLDNAAIDHANMI
ncbi:MAG: hypothetical protein M1600_02990 [Firmicutes bacterium]|nr:hypothetical protein [Bacillota bacterium]